MTRIVPNTQWGRKTEARSPLEGRGAESGIYWPKCFITHSQCLMHHHTTLLFLSTLKSILNMNQLVLLSSLPTLPQKVWNKNEEDTNENAHLMSHMQEPTSIFSAYQPLHTDMWLHGSSAALQRQHIFCKVATPPGRGLWNPHRTWISVKNIKGEPCADFSFWHSFQTLLDHAKVQMNGRHNHVKMLHWKTWHQLSISTLLQGRTGS